MSAATETATTVPNAPLGATTHPSSQTGGAPSGALLHQIRDLGRTLDDVERARVQVGNRIAAIGRGAEVIYEEAIPVAVLASFDLLVSAEGEIVKELERTWKRHPLYAWSRHVPAVGEKLISRLVAEIGEPTLRPVGHFEEGDNAKRRFVVDEYVPRTLAQLRAYCGVGDPRRRKRAARKKDDGMSQVEAMALGNPVAKKRVYLIAKQGLLYKCAACTDHAKAVRAERKAAGMNKLQVDAYVRPAPQGCICETQYPLRHLYDTARATYATRVHDQGVLVGEPWIAAHQDAAAIRFVGKTFLRMLWEAAHDPAAAALKEKARLREAAALKAATTEALPPARAEDQASSWNGRGRSA